MSGGGGGSPVGAAANAPTQEKSSSVYGANTPVLTTADANRYTPTYQQYTPQQTQQQTPQQTVQDMGLQALYQSMANQFAPISQQYNFMDQFYQQPVQRQMPTYQNTALQYQPNRAPAEQSLNRVAKSVILQQKEAAEAELARLKAQTETAADTPWWLQQTSSG